MRKENLKKIYEVEVEPTVKSSAWIFTFNDLMTQLTVFFVLIFSLSTINVLNIQSAQISLQSGLGIFEAGKKTAIGLVSPLTNYDIGKATFTKQLKESIEALDSDSEISVSYSDKGIIISLDESILFKSGSARISPEGLSILDNIAAAILNNISNSIRVEGHTDSDPIQNEKFPSNWELSTARSVNVLKYLIESGKILPMRLSAAGYGESKPLFTNDTRENKAKNRRVEIVISTENNKISKL